MYQTCVVFSCIICSLSNYRRQILDSSKLKDDNFKFDENGRKLSKWVETLWKEEKLLVTGNLNACFPGASKGVIVWEWVKKLKDSFSVDITTCSWNVTNHR